MNLTVAQLRLVLAVGSTRSFTRAAAATMLSQPALSRAVRDVERSVGARLFDRTTRSVVPTAEGLAFLDVADEIVGAFDRGLGRFAAHRDGRAGVLTISALPSLAASVVPEVAAAFVRERPEAQVRVIDGNAAEVLQQVRDGTADMAVTEDPGPAPDLSVRRIGDDPMVAVVPLDCELAQARSASWTELARFPFIALEPGSTLRRLTELAFTRAGVSVGPSVETSTAATAGGLVASGLGVSAVTRAVLPLLAFARIVAVPLTEPVVARRIAVVQRRVPLLSPVAAAFAATLTATLQADSWTTSRGASTTGPQA